MHETLPHAIVSLILLYAAGGFIFAMLARAMFRRRHVVGLLAAWGLGTIGATTLMMWRIHRQLGGRDVAPDARGPLPLWLWFGPLWALAFAAISWRVWRRRAATDGSLVRFALTCLPIYFAALVAFFVLFAIIDVRAWFLG